MIDFKNTALDDMPAAWKAQAKIWQAQMNGTTETKMDIQKLLSAIPEHYELRIWKRDGDTCWEVIDHSETAEVGVRAAPSIAAYGASELSLMEWAEASEAENLDAPFVPHGWVKTEIDPDVKAKLRAEAEQQFSFLDDD